MSRLIDADALDNAFTDLRWDGETMAHWGDRKDWCLHGNEIEKLIQSQPTIDAVPVVRCAECKYLDEDLAIGEWDGSCRFWNTHSVTYSWFCSQGEKKVTE